MQIRFFQALVNKVLFFILISSAAHAQEKVLEAFTPMGTLGESTEMGKQIISLVDLLNQGKALIFRALVTIQSLKYLCQSSFKVFMRI